MALALLTSTADAAERPPLPPCEAGDVRLEVEADAPARVPALCITPDLTSNFLFDANLARVELEGREHFRRVTEAADSFMVVPSEAMRDMEPLRVTVYFVDGAAPASLSFLLVVHPARAVRQLDVIRQTRPVAFYKQEALEARAEVQQCREEKARMQAEQRGPGGLRGLRAAGLLDDVLGVAVKRIHKDIKPRPHNALGLLAALSARAGSEVRGRVAVEVELKNPGTKPWALAGAMLRGAKGEEFTPLPVEETPVSILPGATPGLVMVEFEATTKQARGAYTLTLWDADGRSVILDNVTFP
ncbi:DUF2381 family protein [Archangium primigenium]|uniref:DUF2381 family protein n=1 Tax=[Archangium] primigenium TaxID=2792470 RepID=UPI00195E41D7|nr:DUF2381 family protein [Archangium primigenium]MBM7115725.1 DUF2381 family protein [Archangium primigenium]